MIALEEKNANLTAERNKLEPQAKALHAIAATGGLFILRGAAKLLGLRPNSMGAHLDNKGWTYLQGSVRLPYQRKIDSGHLSVKVCRFPRSGKHDIVREQIMIMPRGPCRLALDLEVQLPPDLLGYDPAAQYLAPPSSTRFQQPLSLRRVGQKKWGAA